LRTNIVLIDFESVQPVSLAVLEEEHFRVIVFVGAGQAKVPFEVAAALQRMGGKAEYVKISGNGRNALDFHIAFYIGQLAAQDPAAYFHVISKDGGFDPLVQHLKSKKIFCSRWPVIDDIPLVKAGSGKTAAERADFFIGKLNEPKVTRARAVKTLSNAIASFFNKQISDAEIADIIGAMQEKGVIDLADGKVSYATDG